MKFICIAGFLLLNVLLPVCVASEPAITVEVNHECVVLMHGLARTSRSMRKLQKALQAQNYAVLNLAYPSTKHSIEVLAKDYLHPALESYCESPNAVIHFVTHSLGGIVLRQYLQEHRIPRLGHVVMLSPPNHGTEIVDLLGENLLFRWMNGPAGQQLGTTEKSLLKQLGPVNFSLGVITGNRSINPIMSTMIPGEDDGKVGVESAKLPDMNDFLVVPYSHTFIMRKKAVIKQIMYFLKKGHFQSARNE